MIRVLALCLVGACTYPEKVYDGPFTCLGAPPPTTATPIAMISGVTAEPTNLTPLSGVTVVLQSTATMTPIFTGTSDAAGMFSFNLNTNSTPVTGIDLFASAPGRENTYFYPPRPVIGDVTFAIAILSTVEATNVALGAGTPLQPGTGSILLTINDCNNVPLSGATLTASAGVVHYFTGINPSMTATATDAGGVALVANAPPGKVTLTAHVMNMTLPPHEVTVVADTFIQTEIQP